MCYWLAKLLSGNCDLEDHTKKVVLSDWWNFKGIVFLIVLPENITVNSKAYYVQQKILDNAVKQKRPQLINRAG